MGWGRFASGIFVGGEAGWGGVEVSLVAGRVGVGWGGENVRWHSCPRSRRVKLCVELLCTSNAHSR